MSFQTKKAALILSALIIVYAFLALSNFDAPWAYIVPSFCWIILTLISIRLYGLSNIKSSFNKTLTILAVILAMTQLMLLVSVSFFTSFGHSPYAGFSVFNILYLFSMLIGTEIVRAQTIGTFPKSRKFLGVALVSLLFAIVVFSPARYFSLGEPLETTKFFGGSFVPALASSVLATLLALLGGPVASLFYMGTLQGFELFSPILPNPDWTIQALVTALVPAFGVIMINQTVKPHLLIHHGLLSIKEFNKKRHRKEKIPFGWIGIALVALILLWGSSGLLGFRPSVVASGSMQPNLNVGDMAIIVHCKASDVQVGDVIQYRGAQEPVIHRVIDKYNEQGQIYFITKGDANGSPDPNPVSSQQIIGKETFSIPAVGWVSIWLKEGATTIYDAVLVLPQAFAAGLIWLTSSGVYFMLPLTFVVLVYAVYVNTKHRRLNR